MPFQEEITHRSGLVFRFAEEHFSVEDSLYGLKGLVLRRTNQKLITDSSEERRVIEVVEEGAEQEGELLVIRGVEPPNPLLEFVPKRLNELVLHGIHLKLRLNFSTVSRKPCMARRIER